MTMKNDFGENDRKITSTENNVEPSEFAKHNFWIPFHLLIIGVLFVLLCLGFAMTTLASFNVLKDGF